MNENNFHIHIEAGESPMSMNLREVWHYRDLIALFTRRTFKLMYKQTILGPLWIVLSPFMTSIIYTVIFGNMAGLSTDGVPKFLFYLCSHSVWAFFADCLRQNSTTFLTNAHVFSKVYFPRLAIPFSTALTACIQLLIHLVMVFALILWSVFKGELSPNWKLLPLLLPVILMAGMMGLGLGILISSVTTKYRDLTFLVGFGLNLWMYLSPVVYPVSQLSGGLLYRLLMLNPMTAPMELARLALLGVGSVTTVSVLSTLIFTAAAFTLGVLTFNKVERTFIDTV
ncbi:MAG: ABC transporter permease [Mogibacterium sp.]|nr:ABC transporter permease [Mogibacterium sp.]